MGTRRQHQDKARRNQEFIEFILESGFPEWIAIAVFYKAVHLVEEMLAIRNVHTTSHWERQEHLKRNFPEILRPFRTLYNFALVARYQFRPVLSVQIASLMLHLEQLERLTALEIAEG